jgi:nitroreductase
LEFQDVVRKRRMVRSFEPRGLPVDVVERILRNAQRAPSAGFSQGWGFLVLEGPLQTQEYWDAVGPDDRDAFRWQGLYNAPLLVICLANKSAYLDRYAEPDKGRTDRSEARWPAAYWDIDTGMAAMLMLLTAVDVGLGALFFGVRPEKVGTLRAAFGIPAELYPIGTIAVGFASPNDPSSPSLKRGHRPAAEVVHRGRW